MPCRVDLFPVYEYFDWRDRTFFLWFNTPVVPLLCGALRQLKEHNLPLTEEQEQWYALHREDDAVRETKGGHLNAFDPRYEEALRYFDDLEKKSK